MSANRSWICIPALMALASCGERPPLFLAPEAAVREAPGPAARTPSIATVQGPAVPWHLTAAVQTTPADPPAGCLIYFTSVIEGRATHAGRLSGVGSTCITNLIQPDPDPPFVPAGPPPYFTASFTNPLWTLTSSNGDEIWIRSDEAVAVISIVDGSLRATGRQRIIGGTGRFAGATGEATVGGANDDGQGPDDFEGSGWIRYRASARAGS